MADAVSPEGESASAAPVPTVESSKPISKSLSARASPSLESSEPTTALDTAKSSRRASLGISNAPAKAAASTTNSANTSARTSPQPDAGASNYGTRSRHRGNNRVNYAEDNDMDFEYTIKQNAEAKSKTSKHEETTSKPNVKEKAKIAPAFTGMMTIEEIMGGAASPVASAKPSRKRKAPDSSNTATPSATQPHPPARKVSHHFLNTTPSARDSNMVSFDRSGRKLKDCCLVADTGDKYKINDFIYLVCEPPGEPYYIARIMEFSHANNDPKGPVDSMRINWMYRPRDINRKELDSRGVFASMHSDSCPITSIRGKCTVKHRSEIQDLDDFKKQKDTFYYSQMYDRYIHRYYDVIPTKAVINVPENVKKVLDERWKYIIVEIGKGKEFTSAVKTCRRCSGYCANDNSVDCAVCKNTYHMNCVQPPLQKKPARGFAWSCGPCSRKQERKLEARNTPMLDGEDEEELFEEEDGDANNTNATSPSAGDGEILTATKEQTAHAKLWPYRYLGIHCKPTDALDYDDRIYPRASSRIGPRHQAHMVDWPGRPFEFLKPAEAKRKYGKNTTKTKNDKLSKETIATMEAEKEEKKHRPKWVIDQPPGFLQRGEDPDNNDKHRTSTAIFKMPEVGESSGRGGDDEAISKPTNDLDAYMIEAKKLAPGIGVKEWHTNFLDRALSLYYSTGYNAKEALAKLKKTDVIEDLKEPVLSKEELKKFEEGVSKYGSQLGDVARHAKLHKKQGLTVRFYYLWKKTDRGKAVWGVREDRKSKKHVKVTEGTFLDDVADDADDSAFDNEKAVKKKRGFCCKFCNTKESRFWRRAPMVTPGQTVPADGSNRSKEKANQLMLALCGRCASLWRKYALRYEDIDDIAKRLSVPGGRTAKRKMDEEFFRELIDACEVGHVHVSETVVSAAAQLDIAISPELTQPISDPARKKQKTEAVVVPEQPKKKIEKPPAPEPPPLIPEAPRQKSFPCNICLETKVAGQELYCCRNCRLTVHKSCYGIPDGRPTQKWLCDCCSNDSINAASHEYVCTLCPMVRNEPDMFELPKTSHRKKDDRQREKERLEKELFAEACVNYAKSQEELGRPLFPREALKATPGFRWAHVICAIFTAGIKFWDAPLLDKPEGLLEIPANRFGLSCGVCGIGKGVCTRCPKCQTPFHPSCAQKSTGHIMGFYVTPVKGSRKDVVNSIRFGNETGHVEAVIYCKAHEEQIGLHPMHEVFEDGTTALQTFLRNFKQADPTFTGTMRKAAAIHDAIKPALPIRDGHSHRGSVSNGTTSAGVETTTVKSEEVDDSGDRIVHLETKVVEVEKEKSCQNCKTKVSPRWHKTDQLNGHSDGQNHSYLCHKCNFRKKNGPPPEAPKESPAPIVERPVQDPAPAPQPAVLGMNGWSGGNGVAPVALPQQHFPAQPRPGPQPPMMNGTSQSPPMHHTLTPRGSFGAPNIPFTNGFGRGEPARAISPRPFGSPDPGYQHRTSDAIPVPNPFAHQNGSAYGPASPAFRANMTAASGGLSAAADPFAPAQPIRQPHPQPSGQQPPQSQRSPWEDPRQRPAQPPMERQPSTNGTSGSRPSFQDLLN